ncbi:MAG: hypothetical protein PHV05_00935 [Candidatus Riflebacteria bacterium]|nr:hypothetical protein [Candidatus Riflebacteria bacterium]
MASYQTCSGSENSVISFLENWVQSNADKRKRYDLWLLTCYLDHGALKETITRLADKIKIGSIYVAYDVTEIYRQGGKFFSSASVNIETCAKEIGAKNIHLFSIHGQNGELFHGKAYGIIPTDQDFSANKGLVALTSANLTYPGILGKGNVEIAYFSDSTQLVKQFRDQFNSICATLCIENEKILANNCQRLRHYEILSGGVFLNKWPGSFKSETALRFKLSKECQKLIEIGDQELRDLGLNIEKGSLTRHLISSIDIPRKSLPKSFLKDFTIETYIGRFCPSSIWDFVEAIHKKDFNSFKLQVADVTSREKLDSYCMQALEIQKKLVARSLTLSTDKDHVDRWRHKVFSLACDDVRLGRLYNGCEQFSIPYRYEDKHEVKKLFGSLEESISLKRKKNLAARKVKEANQSGQSELTINEKMSIQRVFRRLL